MESGNDATVLKARIVAIVTRIIGFTLRVEPLIKLR